MRFVFWSSLAFIVYTYAGYPMLLWCYSRVKRVPVALSNYTPSVDIIMAVRNEEAGLEAKLKNLSQLHYPQDRLQIIVASDGSTDRTEQILQAQLPLVRPVLLPRHQGKAAALNAAVEHATADILVFLDARQRVDADAVRALVCRFADAEVGAVSGELHLENAEQSSKGGLGIYWLLEKVVRKLESATGSVVGVTGAIYALRRELFVPLPLGLLLDDVFVPMNVVRAGKRVVFQSGAVATDLILEQKGREFGRKVRTLTGNYQLLQLAPWLITTKNPLLFRFISHKLFRLLVPHALLLLFLSSAFAVGPFYKLCLSVQAFLYLLAFAGFIHATARRWKPVSVAYTFVLLNAAAVAAFYNFLSRRARWA